MTNNTTQTFGAYSIIGTGTLKRAFVGSRVEFDTAGRFKMAVVKSDNGMWAWEMNGEVAVANQTADHIVAYIRKQHCGHTFIGAVNPAGHDATRCKRCGGGGHLPQYAHIDGGRCYDCGGDGKVR